MIPCASITAFHCMQAHAGEGGGAAKLTAQAAEAAVQLSKRYPGMAPAEGEAEGQPSGGGQAGEGEAASMKSGSESGSEQGAEYDDEEPSVVAARQQRRKDWAARTGWGPEPEASPQELASELARCILSLGAQGGAIVAHCLEGSEGGWERRWLLICVFQWAMGSALGAQAGSAYALRSPVVHKRQPHLTCRSIVRPFALQGACCATSLTLSPAVQHRSPQC